MYFWTDFIYFAIPAMLLWITGAWGAWKGRTSLAMIGSVLGFLVFLSFIIFMWVALERPPLRTMGETRLWYSLFLSLAGILVYLRWKYKWALTFSTVMSCVFIFINLFNPEIHDKSLMPALQSPWFAPHVIVYMFAYALFGVAALIALYRMFKGTPQVSLDDTLNNLIYTGLAFLTIGMLFGALWAKEAWGHYWSWDPKETWAAITWFSYLVYIHYMQLPHPKVRLCNWLLIICFILLQMCWWGINYLPSAQGVSVHTYS